MVDGVSLSCVLESVTFSACSTDLRSIFKTKREHKGEKKEEKKRTQIVKRFIDTFIQVHSSAEEQTRILTVMNPGVYSLPCVYTTQENSFSISHLLGTVSDWTVTVSSPLTTAGSTVIELLMAV